MKISIAVVDDEMSFRKNVIKKLKYVLNNFAFSFEIIEFSNGEVFLKEKKRYDIIFLDIQMPKMNGFKTAETYRFYGKEDIIIFLTNYERFCKEGYKVNAFRFLGKQDEEKVFHEAVSSALNLINGKRSLKFHQDTGQEVYLSLNEIFYIEACGRHILVYTNNKVFKVKEKISDITSLLLGKGFYLVHRAYLVNMQNVISCYKRTIEMSNGDKIYVSEKRYTEFKKCLFEYKFERGYK
ncbi:MAG: response regulator transcription factor [Lachnospiraceae bacterium]|nr:response regulator transcription factor [Lachnospiraceae bacterium]